MTPLFITGIGTEVGKTVCSAVLVEKLKCDYWKPVQSGDLHNSDTDKVRRLITNPGSRFHPEAFRLSRPFSPHKSADLDGVRISIDKIIPPDTDNQLLIEGAGGLMVPLNEKELMIDLIKNLKAEVVLVVRHYLGSINHTLLSLEVLRNRNISLKGILLNGEPDEYSEKIILAQPNVKLLGRIPELNEITQQTILESGSGISELF